MKKIVNKIIVLTIICVVMIAQLVSAKVFMPDTDEEVLYEELKEEEVRLRVKVGWEKEKDGWYYYDNMGNKKRSQLITEKDKQYFLDQNGKMVVGWKRINDNWYYFNTDGSMRKASWLEEGKYKYYFNPDGKMQNKDMVMDNTLYMFLATGELKGTAEVNQDVQVKVSTREELVENVNVPQVIEKVDPLTGDVDRFDTSLVVAVLEKIKFIDDSKKRKAVEADEDDLLYVKGVLEKTPSLLLNQILMKVTDIYICMEDTDGYAMTKTYKDREDNTSSKIEVPFQYIRNTITVIGIYQLGNGIGAFVDEEYRYQNKKPYLSTWWKDYIKSEEGENCMAMDSDESRIYFEDDMTFFNSAFGQYLINNTDMALECPKVCKFFTAIINQKLVK